MGAGFGTYKDDRVIARFLGENGVGSLNAVLYRLRFNVDPCEELQDDLGEVSTTRHLVWQR
jgi:hypothetical protein